MPKHHQPIQPREFILIQNSPATQPEVRDWILSNTFPPVWGGPMEFELSQALAVKGFSTVTCNCLETHRVAVIRMACAAGQSVAAVRRLLLRVASELGCTIPRGGLNCMVRCQRVEAEVVLTDPAV
jgi:hypothetical protein